LELIAHLDIKNLRVNFDFSLICVLVVFEWYLISAFIPSHFGHLSSANQIIIGVAVNVILIVSLVIHESAHVIVGSLEGIKIRQIVLFIFGGVYESETSALKSNGANTSPTKLKFALAGPAASILLAALFGITWFLEFQEINPKEIFLIKQAMSLIFVYASIGNGLLALLNLLPAIPLDGAEILNSIYRRRLRDLSESKKLNISKVISYSFLVSGFFAIFFVSFYSGLLLIMIAWVLRMGMQQYIALLDAPTRY
jgi:Zn-dependent protease